MSVVAAITTSLDGYVAGPDDKPGQGLGVGGERLHDWVMGGSWTYEDDAAGRSPGGLGGVDREFLQELTANVGAGICGRNMYEASEAWGGTNPFNGTLFVLTHRTDEAPDPSTGFRFVDGLDTALQLATEAAGERDVAISGGASVIRQALAAGHVDELAISTAPVVLGAGKRLFDGFDRDVDLEILKVYPSRFATHVRYRVTR
ncbi:MAG TPA: dihydrofolate reductase family protein [Acidimicrobiales bacterium]